jgi:uncharacterized protein (DUF305 family)
MITRTIAFATAVLSVSACGASAQQNQGQMQHHSGGQMAMSNEALPEECRTAVQASGPMPNIQGVDMQGMQQSMHGMMANMNEAQKAYMDTMMKMHGPMMSAHMIKDSDVAFVCGMIPHHQGAIDMARVVLKTGDNAEAKKMAETVIKAQEQEIAEMKDWLKKNAKKEGAN